MRTRASSSSRLIAAAAAFALLGLVSASTDPSSYSCCGNNGVDFTYSQTLQLNLSSDMDEDSDRPLVHWRNEEHMTSTKDPLFGPEPSVVESELLYGDISENEGCFVSSRTITEPVPEDESHWCFGERSSVEHERSALFKQTAFTFDEDSDDEDDDNDYDGHSSMLSNASLRQKTTTVGGYYFVNGKDNHESIPRRNADSLSAQPRSASHMALLKLRGGGRIDLKSMASTALHSEISKKLIVAAVVTLVFEGLIGHILEFLKIVMQTANDDTTYLNVIRAITAEKGIMGLWDGFCPWGIVQAVSKGAVFGLAHASALATLLPLAKKGKLPMALALTLAGGIGGGFQGYVLSPTLLLKTRVMTNPVFREKMSMLRTTFLSFRIGYDVVKTEGFSTLMKGSNVFATKRVFDWASRYFFADMFEALFAMLKKGQSLSVAEKSASSLLGGVFSTLITLPLDVLVAKTQDAKKAGVRVSALTLFQDELREKGISGLRNAYMRGFEARLLHVCLTTLVIKTGTPIAYEAMFGSTK